MLKLSSWERLNYDINVDRTRNSFEFVISRFMNDMSGLNYPVIYKMWNYCGNNVYKMMTSLRFHLIWKHFLYHTFNVQPAFTLSGSSRTTCHQSINKWHSQHQYQNYVVMLSYKGNNQMIQNITNIPKEIVFFSCFIKHYEAFKNNKLDFYSWTWNETQEILWSENLTLNNIVLFNILYNNIILYRIIH